MPGNYAGVRVPQTVRLPADLHRACVAQARNRRISLNRFITESLSRTVMETDFIGWRQNQEIYNDDGSKLGQA